MFNRFWEGLQQDFKGFIYFNMLFMLFRITFLGAFPSLVLASSKEDLLLTLWYGGRISLKTAGILMVVSFLFATLPYVLKKSYPANFLRKLWHYIATLFFTFLFVARVPYYKVYTSSYNLMLINGLKDDIGAIYKTLVQEYNLWGNVFCVFLITAFLCYVINKILETKTYQPKNTGKLKIGLIVFMPAFFIFTRFGGGYSYDTGIHWESAARLNSNFLNEDILDDGQALYRVYSIYSRVHQKVIGSLSVKKVRDSIKVLGGNEKADTIDNAFVRYNKRNATPLTPNQVVLIFGENHALWPFLDRYKDLHLVNREKNEILSKSDCAQVYRMLAGGNGTMTSLNTLVSGLPDAGIYPNYENESFRTKYATGIGNVMQKLGYKTVFWYGGLATWQNIEKYVKAQGFDEFHCVNDIVSASKGVWGIPDGDLFKEINSYMAKENKKVKTFHFVLTTSNHPPYSLDVNSLGFPEKEVEKNLPDSIANTKETLKQLGHIWYSDQTISDFVKNTTDIDPSVLFVITGDHAERFSFAKEEKLDALSAVPCIFYGKGITPDIFFSKSVGVHEQIAPTLVELLTSEGYVYSSVLPSLLSNDKKTFNYNLYAYDGEIGKLITSNKIELPSEVIEQIKTLANASQIITYWRVNKGNGLE